MQAPIVLVDASLRGHKGPSRDERRQLQRRVRTAARRLGIGPEAMADLVVRICDDQAITMLKQEFFGVRQATDVLSFPGPGTDGRGDVALSWPMVQRQARAHRVPDLHEATILVVHALAHLLGHDHAQRADGLLMHRVEVRALRALRVKDLPRSYSAWPVRGAAT